MTYLEEIFRQKEMTLNEAKKILRESIIDNKADAELVLDVFSQTESIFQVVEWKEGALKAYEGVVRRGKEKGENVSSVERSMEIWREELVVIKQALKITGYKEH